MGENLHLHADHEEHFIHPLLSDRMPGGAEKLEADHRIMRHTLGILMTHFEGIKTKDMAFERRQELGLEFYLAFNRFVTFYVSHINDEEETAQPVLWRLCTDEELLTTWNAILASQTPEEAAENLTMIFHAANTDELAHMLEMGKKTMPSQAFQNVTGLAQRLLSAEEWNILKEHLGM